MISDLGIVFKVYLISLGLQFLVWPWVSKWFKELADKGWALGRVLGLLAVGLPVWFLGHVWPVNTDVGVGVVMLGLVLVGLRSIRFRSTPGETSASRRPPPGRNYILVEEGLFVLGLLGLSLIRGFQPDILGLEKFMDFGFVKQYLVSSSLPVNDMWLAGESINYYSFGHFLTSILVRIWGVPLGIGYNLMLAWILGTSLALSFLVVVSLLTTKGSHLGRARIGMRSLKRQEPSEERSSEPSKGVILGGVMGALLTCLGGNSHALWYLLKNKGFAGYWYADATRFIENTIHEFPGYSFVVSDLHGHVLGLPIVLAFVLVLVNLLNRPYTPDSTPGETSASLRPPAGEKSFSVILGVLLGVMMMTNTWDVAVYGLLMGVFFVSSRCRPLKVRNPLTLRCRAPKVTNCLTLGLVAGVVALPWFVNFEFFSDGLRLVSERSPLWQLGVLWGGHVVVVVIAMTIWFRSIFKSRLQAAERSEPSFGRLRRPAERRRFGSALRLGSDPLVLALGVTAVLLLLIPEVVYVKDIYTTHQRANTMFKLTYQAFIMMGLVFGWVVGQVFALRSTPGECMRTLTGEKLRFRRRFGTLLRLEKLRYTTLRMTGVVILFVLWGGFMLFPVQAFSSYYGGFKKYKGLDGLTWLKADKNKWGVVEYLEKNRDGKNMIEAVGESYSKLNSVSAFSGTPTVVGWKVHEWLWRGGYDVVKERERIVREFYETGNLEVIEEFEVGWVVVGPDERKKYKVDENRLVELGEVVWRGGESYLVKVDETAAGPSQRAGRR